MSSTTKADRLKEQFGQNIAQVVGQRGRAGASPASPPAPESDKYAGAVRSRTFGELPVSALVCESQARTEFDAEALDQLTTSIRRFGQLTPIRVRHDAASNRWVVLVGERRLRACRAAGLERVRVEFVERAMGESDILAEQVVENVARADLRPVELGHAYQRLLDLNGWTAQELAEQLGVEPTSVYRALALLRLPEDVAAQVEWTPGRSARWRPTRCRRSRTPRRSGSWHCGWRRASWTTRVRWRRRSVAGRRSDRNQRAGG
jgi:ParB family chromosome partitioning protein